jgi:dTDP-4-dehydrorhamnose 3,5-epimerase
VIITPLDVPDAWLCTPRQFPDDRGVFLEWFRADLLAKEVGRRFEVVQANYSVSRRGVVRGLHYADVPPGQAKYVYCSRGSVLDVVVDIRAGSPTFGATAVVELDDVDRRGLFVSEGLGHAFCALSETADVAYLVSTEYNPVAEHGVDPRDPALGLRWPVPEAELLIAPRDTEAPTLDVALRDGLLPSYEACRRWYAELAV